MLPKQRVPGAVSNFVKSRQGGVRGNRSLEGGSSRIIEGTLQKVIQNTRKKKLGAHQSPLSLKKKGTGRGGGKQIKKRGSY